MQCSKCLIQLRENVSRCPKCGAYVSINVINHVRSQLQTTSEIVHSKLIYYQKLREIYGLFEFENQIRKERKKIFSGKSNKSITTFLHEKVVSHESANELLELYKSDFRRDLIEDLKSLSSNYEIIESYLARFIEFKVVESTFPHDPSQP